MKNFVARLHNFFIPPSYSLDEQEFRKARILINTTLITSIFAFSYFLQTFFLKQYHLTPFMALWCAVFFLIAYLLKWGVPRKVCTNIFVATTFISAIWEIYWTGGLQSSVLPWMSMVAVTAILLNTPKNAWVWFIIALIATIVIGVVDAYYSKFPIEMDMRYYNLSVLFSYVGLVSIMFVIAMVMENAFIGSLKKLDQKNKIIEEEKKRSDDLLLNILPAEVMEELKQTGKTTARNYDLVTVLFADFKNFTHIIEELPPEELVSGIDNYFETFDKIIGNHQIEKIKTVGDAYICASGLPVMNSNNPVIIVEAALEINAAINKLKEERKQQGKVHFDVRIGIHSGPLVAGVVGIKKFAYDIWGDTVNTAARMQQMGEAGKINISGTTHDLVKHRFHCTSRGRIEVKNKGLIEMYFVEGKK